jgi:hypothetical protein
LIRYIAALLVLFGMTVDEAQEEFCRVYNTVFSNEESTPEQRSAKLAAAIKQLMAREKYQIPESATVTDVLFGGDCRVYVFVHRCRHQTLNRDLPKCNMLHLCTSDGTL